MPASSIFRDPNWLLGVAQGLSGSAANWPYSNPIVDALTAGQVGLTRAEEERRLREEEERRRQQQEEDRRLRNMTMAAEMFRSAPELASALFGAEYPQLMEATERQRERAQRGQSALLDVFSTLIHGGPPPPTSSYVDLPPEAVSRILDLQLGDIGRQEAKAATAEERAFLAEQARLDRASRYRVASIGGRGRGAAGGADLGDILKVHKEVMGLFEASVERHLPKGGQLDPTPEDYAAAYQAARDEIIPGLGITHGQYQDQWVPRIASEEPPPGVNDGADTGTEEERSSLAPAVREYLMREGATEEEAEGAYHAVASGADFREVIERWRKQRRRGARPPGVISEIRRSYGQLSGIGNPFHAFMAAQQAARTPSR